MAPQRLVIAAQRRPAITGDKTGGMEAGLFIQAFLHQGQTYQRVDTRQKDPAGFAGECGFEGIRRIKTQFLIAFNHCHGYHLLIRFCFSRSPATAGGRRQNSPGACQTACNTVSSPCE